MFPSEDDDVVTSPYNTALALSQLAEHADCVMPVENGALSSIVDRAATLAGRSGTGSARAASTSASAQAAAAERKGAFDSMNELAARMLTGLTAGMRFPGPLNVDLNEITTNLVPFSGMQFLVPSLSPAVTMAAAGIRRAQGRGGHARAGAVGSRLLPGEPRSADALFSDAIDP